MAEEPLRTTVARDRSVDFARGLAIVMIVLGHVNRGLMASGLGAPWAPDLDRVLYLFHISAFAYLSGLYLQQGLERKGMRPFLVERTALFLWLYVLWHVLQVGVKIVTAPLVNSPASWSDLVRFWIPEGQLWFLPWLASVTLVVSLWRPWSSQSRTVSLVLFAGCMGLAMWGVDPLPAFSRGLALLLPFAVGALLGSGGHRRIFTRSWSMTLAVVGLGALVVIGLTTQATPPTLDTPDRTAVTVALGVVGCLAGTAGLLALSGWLAQLGSLRLISFLGQRSLEIFLAHIVGASGIRIVLSRAGVEAPLAHLVIGTAVGLAAPLVLWWLARKLGIRGLFALPFRIENRAPSPSSAS